MNDQRAMIKSRARKILYIGSSLPCRSETFVYREIFGLRKRGLDVFAASVHPPQKNLGEDELDQLAKEAHLIYPASPLLFFKGFAKEILRRPKDSFSTLSFCLSLALSPFQKLTLAQRVKLVIQALGALGAAEWARERQIEHIHAHMAHVPASVAMFLGKQLRIPFSFTGHAADLFFNPSLLKEKLKRASFTSCISQWHRRYYRGLSDVESEKLPLIRCGIDVEAFHPSRKEEPGKGKLRFASVGRLVPKKGHEYLIQELSKISSLGQDWECLIVGDGAEKERLKQMIEGSKNKSRIHLLGAKDNREVLPLLENADIFVLPCVVDGQGDRDGIPVSILEAMACGLPVISGDIPTIHEAIDNKVNGILIDPKVPGELGKCLEDLARSPEKRKELGFNAREKIVREFSIDCSLDRLCEFFDRSISQGNAGKNISFATKPEQIPCEASKLVVISPCKDEAEHLEKTIKSVLKQTLKPAVWIIVDDGSSDETPRLLADYEKRHDFIKVIRREGGKKRNVGPGVVDAFYFGLDAVDLSDFEFLCKLDLDLELPEKYFELLIERMRNNPRIGTCSGKPFNRNARTGKLSEEPTGDEMSAGMTKLYRTECFKEIGGFVRHVMWDGIDCHRCRMLGWIACSYNEPDLRFVHLRPMGSSQKGILTGRMRHGMGQYFMGTGVLYILSSSLYRMTTAPWIIGGLSIFLGYMKAFLTGAPRYQDPKFRKFLRRFQRRSLLFGKRHATEMTNEEQALIWAEKKSAFRQNSEETAKKNPCKLKGVT